MTRKVRVHRRLCHGVDEFALQDEEITVRGPGCNRSLNRTLDAICRKVAMAEDGGEIEMWGDGKQTRSFLFVSECLEGIRKLMDSETFSGPVNIGSEEMVSINQLAEMVMEIAGKKLMINHIPGPTGVRGRNSDNKLINEKLGWAPSRPLREGLEKTYGWIKEQVEKQL